MDAILGAAYTPGSSMQLGAPAGGAAGGGLLAGDDVSSNRIAAFQTAQEVDAALGKAAGVLRELVERVNRKSARQADEPLEVVRGILDSQMAALAYVDREAAALLGEARTLDQQLAMAGHGGGGGY